MRVLVATSVVNSIYTREMLQEFGLHGASIELFDIGRPALKGFWAKVAFRIPLLHDAIDAIRAALLKKRLAQLPDSFDAVNIHYAEPIFRYLAPSLKRKGRKLITTIWGSDFLRAGPRDLRNLKYTLDASDIVTTNNAQILEKLVARYPGVAGRVRVVRWGLKSLDVILTLNKTESKDEMRTKLGVPLTKVIVTCGYNANRGQRHATIIEALTALSAAGKSKIFVLFPMTYPGDPEYIENVQKLLESTQIEHRIITDEMAHEDVCRMRIATDCVVNIQMTDSLSASIQEHMLAGCSMIIGDWLPYRDFEQMGIPFQKVSGVEEITMALEKAIMAGVKKRLKPPYENTLYEYSSWTANRGKWLELYSA